MEPVQAAELVAPTVQLTASFYIMRATNAGLIVIFNKFTMYDWVLKQAKFFFKTKAISYTYTTSALRFSYTPKPLQIGL